jgi:predicted GNAT family acetyltransferase
VPEPVLQRFIDGFARQVELDPALLHRPGTTLVGRADRAGSNLFAAYRIVERVVIWSDPVLVDRLAHLADETTAIEWSNLAEASTAAGLEPIATATMRYLPDRATAALDRSPQPSAYHHRRLRADHPADVNLVRAFADRSDADDVEQAALDDLDNFDEAAIHVLSVNDELVAYASAAPWDWDPTFADIGVLVDRAHRRRGLGRFVVAESCAELLSAERLPLYRHEGSNLGSATIAQALGFEVATEAHFFQLPEPQ